MRRARGLRVSSTRDVCIFCATRQLAVAEGPFSCPIPSQRRQLNSSSRAPQSAEGIMYKDANEGPKAMSQAEKMRAALAANAAFAPPMQAQGAYLSPAHRARAALGTQTPQQAQSHAQRQPPPDRRSSNRSSVFDGPGRNQSRDRYAPQARRVTSSDGYTTYRPSPPATPQSRYRVNMESRPQVDMPAFGAGHLRRRTERQPERAQYNAEEQRPRPATRTQPRRTIDQDEISRLLGNAVTDRPTTQYRPLTREANTQRKCWHCGSLQHQSFDCPSKPILRERTPPRRQQAQQSESIADAAQQWRQKAGAEVEAERPPTVQEEADRRARNVGQDRRSSRFDLGDVEEVKNRYEQPEKRRGGFKGRRVMREEEDEEGSERVVGKAERKRLRAEAKKAAQIAKAEPTPIQLPEYISVANLASMLKTRTEDFARKLEDLGFEDVQNDHILNAEHAGLIAQEFNFEPLFQAEEEDGDLYPAPATSPEEYAELPARPPVVTIMGHVDHGKTTILDYMRSTSVAATEFGGITQHIGAFSVPLANGKKITFLDTPGHSAFETMRARGANVTDIVVLVVAADDSVMPQTVEAIKHAQAAQVPMIVAINKVDKQQADPDAVKLDLGRHGIEIEDFGGDVQAVCVSGKTGQGIPELEEAISTLSELLDHRADPKASVEGWVLEGTTKKSGRVATVLVRSGTLRQGTALVAGATWTRVRSLRNEAGVVVKEAGPGIAVEVDGWRDQPIAGDVVLQVEDEQHATSVTEIRLDKVEREQMARDMDAVNESRRQEAERREAEEAAEKAAANGEEEVAVAAKEKGPEIVSFIIKGDVSGSVEAVIDSVSALGNAEVSTRILRHGVGAPSEFDIQHAADAQGHIVNFNTAIPPHVARLAEEKDVKILDSNIIYRVTENVKDLLSEKLKPKVIQKVMGEAEIAAIFEISLGGKKKLKVAGSKVRNGVVDRGARARVLRKEEVVHDGTISTLKNVKKDVEQMRKDTECGISFEDWEDFKVGDRVQCYEETFEKRSL
ncbi:translation initiation factor-like protein IF-2 [Setomelanomma holmii]|uniref:Translation initiation factor IF-2, mitochondrial n=1 Tax=Setomelanomma holmii TaxID=210430 RepID=A0A9P4LP30_9PLEO|nr:translation initiation factor-like protein IF-2 [Setomelanomma holmii]